MPLLLLTAGLWLGGRLRFFWFCHPIRTIRTLRDAACGDGTSPAAALSMALAGTLGVGNIAGVATAITAGGAGAVLWMVLGALCAMGVKYAEVYLAVRYRRQRTVRGQSEYYGGAMYYIRDGMERMAAGPRGRRGAWAAGGVFALLCACNALLTGNVLQVHAATACVKMPPLAFGILFAGVAFLVSVRGTHRVSRITAVLIPALAGTYVLISLIILLANAAVIPEILRRIWREAWAIRPAAGGLGGYGISRAIRYGVTRGILSNEAGCGTAPTAHAAAHTKSPHHQGCFGIFEVFADTVLLCTMTALVILLHGEGAGEDGIALSLHAYAALGTEIGGPWLGSLMQILLRISVVLFAFSTVVCQSCYGVEALRYFMGGRTARRIFLGAASVATVAGAVISPGIMWQMADLIISAMTAVNVICVAVLWKTVSKRL